MKLIESEKERFYELLKESNDKRLKRWYKLKDLVVLKDISYKSLKKMIKPLYLKHSKTGLIYKKGRRYYISYKVLDEFVLKHPRKEKIPNWYNYDWRANISYTTRDKYDLSYHEEIIKQIENATITVNFLSAIEEDLSGRLHVHMLADWDAEVLQPVINNILKFYLGNEYSFYCKPVELKSASIDYLLKNPQKLIY